MLEFLAAGGYTTVIVLLLGTVMIATGARFAASADTHRLALIKALTWALVFAVVSGVAANLMVTLRTIVRDPDFAKEPLLPLLEGIGESISPVILGGAIASITWILVAFGVRRMPRE